MDGNGNREGGEQARDSRNAESRPSNFYERSIEDAVHEQSHEAMLPRVGPASAHGLHVGEKNARNRNKHNLTPNFFEITQGREADSQLQFDAHKENDILPDTNFQNHSNEKSLLFSPDGSAHKLLGPDSRMGSRANSHNRNSIQNYKDEYTDTQGADSNAVVIDDFTAQLQLDEPEDANGKSEAFPLKINDKIASFGQKGANQLKTFIGLQPREQKDNSPSPENQNAPSPMMGKHRSEKTDASFKSKKLAHVGKAGQASRSQIDAPSPSRLNDGKKNRRRPLKLGQMQASNLSRSTVQSEPQEGKLYQSIA